MAMNAALAIGAAIIAPKVASAVGLGPNTPQMPTMIAPPANAASEKAVDDKKKRKAVGAFAGAGDQILTGAKGLGAIPGENVQSKTLLGY